MRFAEVIGNTLQGIVLCIIIVFFSLPFFWLITAAFTKNPGVFVKFRDFTLSNFANVFKKDTARWIANSLFIGTTTTLIVIPTAFFAAYVFARYNFACKDLLLFALITSMTIPLSAIMLPIFSLARIMNLTNTRIGVALVIAARQIPMALWVLKEFINGIPVEIEEAAKVDGASLSTIVLRVIFPLSAPGLAVVGLMSFIAGWGDFVISLILISSEKLFPISMGIYKASVTAKSSWGYVTTDYGLMAAISLLYLIPPVIVFALTQRHLVRGMVIGAVKE